MYHFFNIAKSKTKYNSNGRTTGSSRFFCPQMCKLSHCMLLKDNQIFDIERLHNDGSFWKEFLFISKIVILLDAKKHSSIRY
jgi:hypothetical protein